MKVTAFVLSILAGVFSTIQSCVAGIGGALGSGIAAVTNDDRIKQEAEGMFGASVGIFMAAILAFIGGAFALKGRTAGWVLLGLASGICYIAAANSVFKDGNVWGAVYALAGFFSIIGLKNPTAPQPAGPQ